MERNIQRLSSHLTPKDDVTQCPYLDRHPSTIRIFHSAVSDWDQSSLPGKLCEGLTLWEKKIGNIAVSTWIMKSLKCWNSFWMAPSIWQFKMFEPEFYRLQNQQANPTQQQMPTPIIRRITCERKKKLNENWRPFFHRKIQV